jgi:hypothetical protein
MPLSSTASKTMPASAAAALRALGDDLKTARQRRGESLRAWALRMDVSVPTLVRMEKGDAAVGIGVYVTALFLVQRHQALGDVARPEMDAAALATEIARARAAHAPRKVGKVSKPRTALDKLENERA